MRTLTTRSAKEADVTHKWIVVDAEGAVLGRLASFIALHLRGKHRADFTPHADTGDHVVVINAGKVALTGRKLERKIYYWHTGHPGGIKERTAGKILNGKHPERVVEKAVERMMPKESPLARKQLGKLRVYAGAEHPHAAQGPETVDFKSFNRKNSRIG
jgi:large subunit ribosomal protein L13